MDTEKLKLSTTTDGKPPREGWENEGAPAPKRLDGQHEAYWVLSEEERSKGFARPVRNSYKHETCGAVTTMGRALSETYAVDPSYYGSTFCAACRNHFPVGADGQFTWTADGSKVGT